MSTSCALAGSPHKHYLLTVAIRALALQTGNLI